MRQKETLASSPKLDLHPRWPLSRLPTHTSLKFQPCPSQLDGAITGVDEQITRPFEPRVIAT